MTKKNYIQAVEQIKKSNLGDMRQDVVEMFIRFFKEDSPSFNADTFRKACKVSTPEVKK